ncbi:hypothetical protein diail_6763 [Diaporthe ilicicola]|nr:hypothetical protein diail_6763 [Diaporthe ilicicola]
MPTSPIRLAIVGKTGAGKTSFLAKALDLDDENETYVVGDGLDSCTQKLQVARLTLDGREVELVDTPGFDDSGHNDGDTLFKMTDWLMASYKSNILLNGVIYMEPVSETRAGRSERERIELVKSIIGSQIMHKVVIASSMWDTGNRLCQRNEDNRVKDNALWGEMVGPGKATVKHFENTRASTMDIIRHFMDAWRFPPRALLLQTELARNNGVLKDTTAGRLAWKTNEKELQEQEAKIQFTGGTEEMKQTVEKKKTFLSRLEKFVVSYIPQDPTFESKVSDILQSAVATNFVAGGIAQAVCAIM